MKKNIIIILLLMNCITLIAQVGIETETVTPGIALEVNGNARIKDRQLTNNTLSDNASLSNPDKVLSIKANGEVVQTNYTYKAIVNSAGSFTSVYKSNIEFTDPTYTVKTVLKSNDFTIDAVSHLIDNISVANYSYKAQTGTGYIQLHNKITLRLVNSLGVTIASQTGIIINWAFAPGYYQTYGFKLWIVDLPVGTYHYEVDMQKSDAMLNNPSDQGRKLQIDVSNAYINYNRNLCKTIKI